MLSFGGNSFTNILPSHSSSKLSLSIKQAVKNSTVPLSSKNPKLILKYGPLPCNKLPPDSWLCLQSEFFDAHKNLKTGGSACFPYLWELLSPRHQRHCKDGRLLKGCHRSNQVPSDQTEMCAEPGNNRKCVSKKANELWSLNVRFVLYNSQNNKLSNSRSFKPFWHSQIMIQYRSVSPFTHTVSLSNVNTKISFTKWYLLYAKHCYFLFYPIWFIFNILVIHSPLNWLSWVYSVLKIVGWCLPPPFPPRVCAPPQDLRTRQAKNFASLATSLTISFSSCLPKKALV